MSTIAGKGRNNYVSWEYHYVHKAPYHSLYVKPNFNEKL